MGAASWGRAPPPPGPGLQQQHQLAEDKPGVQLLAGAAALLQLVEQLQGLAPLENVQAHHLEGPGEQSQQLPGPLLKHPPQVLLPEVEHRPGAGVLLPLEGLVQVELGNPQHAAGLQVVEPAAGEQIPVPGDLKVHLKTIVIVGVVHVEGGAKAPALHVHLPVPQLPLEACALHRSRPLSARGQVGPAVLAGGLALVAAEHPAEIAHIPKAALQGDVRNAPLGGAQQLGGALHPVVV